MLLGSAERGIQQSCPRRAGMLEEPSTNQSAPLTRKTKPTISRMMNTFQLNLDVLLGAGAGVGAGAGAGATGATGLPQPLQNFAFSASRLPHFGQKAIGISSNFSVFWEHTTNYTVPAK